MSSILIKGMEKPKECYCCPCSTINMNGRWGKCNLLGRDYAGDPHKIYEDCPLAELPSHGRLVDADEITENSKVFDNNGVSAKFVREVIALTPTVIDNEDNVQPWKEVFTEK